MYAKICVFLFGAASPPCPYRPGSIVSLLFGMLASLNQVDTYAVPNGIRIRQAAVVATTTAVNHPPPAAASAAGAGDSSDNVDDLLHQVLRISWDNDAAASINRGTKDNESNTSTIPIAWLRQHCTSATARDLRQRYGRAAHGASCRPRPILWGADVFSRPGQDDSSAAVCMHYDELLGRDALDGPPSSSCSPSSPSASASSTLRPPAPARASARLVHLLRSRGIALVRGVPTTEEGTRALALRVGGSLRSTLYGPGMWATSAEASAGEEAFRDSAYSSDALALHTDCGYLADPPGVQVRQRHDSFVVGLYKEEQVIASWKRYLLRTHVASRCRVLACASHFVSYPILDANKVLSSYDIW